MSHLECLTRPHRRRARFVVAAVLVAVGVALGPAANSGQSP
jgi:hypothetical protein